jgi:hypothetical protein
MSMHNEDASISGIAPVAAGNATVMSKPFPKTAFGGSESPEEFEPVKPKKVADTEFELRTLLGL